MTEPGSCCRETYTERQPIASNYLKPCFGFSVTSYSFLFLSRVEITVRKKKISHSTNSTTQTGSYYCVNRLHPTLKSLQRSVLFSEQHYSKRRSFHIVCPIKLQCFLMNLQRNIAKNKTKKKLLSNFLCCC